ncbi:MAG: sigma-70 family RNA polymerase sigma factor [Planctomycetota bacterium]
MTDEGHPEQRGDVGSVSDPAAAGADGAREAQRRAGGRGVALPAQNAEEDALDHALVRRAQAGEEEAFAALVRRHQRRAVRVARSMVPSDEDAQDLAQEAFLRVFRSLDRFDFQHAFTTWLYRIVTNLCIDHLRRRRPQVSTAGLDEDDAEFDLPDPRVAEPSGRLEAAETGDEVRAVLETLAPHFQSVLTLREIEGLPCNEIAEIVGATHVTVRWRLHRGRKLFQEEWERRARLREARGGEGTLDQDLGGESNRAARRP